MVSITQNYRLIRYDADGARTGELPYPDNWNASLPLNDLGAAKLTYPVAAPGAQMLQDPCEVAIEAYNGSGWEEIKNGRFRVVQFERNAAQGNADVISFTLVSYGGIMDDIPVMPSAFLDVENYDDKGKRKMLSANAGQIITTILTEARTVVPGVAPQLELTFTPTNDSYGRPWSKVQSLYYEPGLSLLSIIQNLADQYRCDFWLEGRKLYIVEPESRTQHRKITLTASHADEAPIRATYAGLTHAAILIGDEGNVWLKDNPAAITPWGKAVKIISQGGVKDNQTATALIENTLRQGSRARKEYTYATKLAALDWIPAIDVNPGDWIKIDYADDEEELRIYQITINGGGDLTQKISLTLGDRFEDAQAKTNKKIKGIVNGAQGDAGTGTTPSKAAENEPRQPQGLVAESEGYWENYEPQSLIRIGFAPVTYDVHDLAIQIAYYEVNVGGKITNTAKTTNITLDAFAPNKTVAISVKAVSKAGKKSAPLLGTITTVAPDEKLARPTKLQGEAENAIVQLEWDGTLQEPGTNPHTPPAHFSHLLIEESTDQTDWKTVGTALAGGLTLDRQGVELGDKLYYRAWAVDRLRRRSDFPSEVTEVEIKSELKRRIGQALKDIQEEVYTSEIDIKRLAASPGTNFKNGVIEALATDKAFARLLVTEKVIVGTAQNPVKSVGIADGAITAPKIQASTALISKLFTEALLAGRITSRMFSTEAGFKGDRIQIDRYGIKATDSAGRNTFSIDRYGVATFEGNITSRATITGASIVGAVIKTSNSATRVQLDSGGLTSYHGGNMAMRLDDGRLMFWDGNKFIGQFANQRWNANPTWRGISMDLDYEGYYLSMGYKESVNANTYTSVFRIDPWGYTNGGAKGINIDLPIVCGPDATDNFWQRIKFARVKFQGWSYPALLQNEGRTGIIFGTGGLFFLQGNSVYPLSTILQKVGY